jgi:carbon storage regulator
MLVLTRREGEKILIGDNIEIKIVSIGAGMVRIGFDAPSDLPIDREEVRKSKLLHPEGKPKRDKSYDNKGTNAFRHRKHHGKTE